MTLVARLQRWIVAHPVGARRLELVLVPFVAQLVILALGVTLWTQPHTPDSEFYFTLAAFGNDVTDVVANPAYYWTRVGVVVPLHALTDIVGVAGAYWIWHFVLIAVALVPTYALLSRLVGRLAAVSGSLFILLNLVFLTVVGNPYVTSAVVPLFVAQCALLTTAATATSRRHYLVSTALAGVAVGWIAASNQFAALFAVAVLAFGVLLPHQKLRQRAAAIGLAAWTAATTFLSFVFAGSMIFPAFNWWATTRVYSKVLDASAFQSNTWTWLTSNPALLVPPLLVVGALILNFRSSGPQQRIAAVSAALAVVGIGFGVWYQFVSQGAVLEFQAYSAYLWGPALVAGSVCAALLVQRSGKVAIGAAAVFAGLLVGAWIPTGDGFGISPAGVAIMLVPVVAIVLATGRLAGHGALVACIGACVALPAGVQLLQSATGTTAGLKYQRVFYQDVLRGKDFKADYELDLEFSRWALDQEGVTKLMVWSAPVVGPGGPASMLFQGPNSVTLGFEAAENQVHYTRVLAPSHIVLVAQSDDQLRQLQTGLSTFAAASAPASCKRFPARGEAVPITACLTPVSFAQ